MKIAWSPLLSLLIVCCVVSATMGQSGQRDAKAEKRLFNHKSVEKAWEAAIAGKKPLLVMFTSDHCVFCQKMLTQTYGHPAIKQMLIGRTESVLAHASDYSELVQKMGLRGFPTSLLISPEGKVLAVMEGFVEPRDFAQQVKPLLEKKAT